MPPKADDLKKAIELLLDIPDIKVEDVVETRDGNYLVTAVSTKKRTECHRCGKHINTPYGYGEWT